MMFAGVAQDRSGSNTTLLCLWCLRLRMGIIGLPGVVSRLRNRGHFLITHRQLTSMHPLSRMMCI